MKFSAPTIAMLASSASIASATKIVKRYIASPAHSNSTATDSSGAGSRRLDYELASGSAGSASASAKSSKASGKSGKAATSLDGTYVPCPVNAALIYQSNLEIDVETFPSIPRRLTLESSFSNPDLDGKFVIAALRMSLGCEWFDIENSACGIRTPGYAEIEFIGETTTAFPLATGSNVLQSFATSGKFLDNPTTNLAGEELITTYSLTCANPPVTKVDTREGLRPVNICSLQLGFQKPELDLFFQAETSLALYDESDNVECGDLNEV